MLLSEGSFHDHWTDSVRWKNVETITDSKYNGYNTWDQKYYAAAKILQQKGGGVVYFPPLPLSQQTGLDSTYYFPTHLFLQTNALIRGARSLAPNATDSAFAPQTLFEFPKYLFNGITNVPNSTAFKFIVLQNPDSAFNTGIVDVDINRATIHLSQTFSQTIYTPKGVTNWPTGNITGNIILLGVRQNNAAIPDPAVPSITSPQQFAWQRWSYRLGFNMNINANKNIVVCNNRINDFLHNTTRPISSDNFEQINYIASGYPTGLPGSQSIFDYAAHNGIIVNRLKQDSINLTNSNPGPLKNYLENTTYKEEPNQFATGIEIRNNWIYKTIQTGIMASGNGLLINNNVLRDNPTKQIWIDGLNYLTSTTTNLNNRGLDFSGWNVTVSCNDIEVERTSISNLKFLSQDGVGLVCQPYSGTTVVNHIVRNNNVKIQNPIPNGQCPAAITCVSGYCFFESDINNVQIEGNNIGGTALFVDANDVGSTNQPRTTLNNVIVRNNFNIAQITALGEKGGSLSYVYNNSGTGSIIRSCNVSVNADTNQFNKSSNSGFGSLITNTCCGFDTSINPSPNCIPVVKWQTPLNDTTIYRFSSDSLVTFKAAVTYCSPDSVVFYLDNERIGRANYSNGIATLNYLLKKSDRNAHLLVAYAYKYEIIDCSSLSIPPDTNHTITYSSAALIGLNFNPAPLTAPCNAAQVVTHLKLSPDLSQNLEVYPNPFDESFFIKAPNSNTNWQAQVYDVTGKKIYGGQLTITGNNPGVIESGNWPKGIYYLILNSGNQTFTKKLLKM